MIQAVHGAPKAAPVSSRQRVVRFKGNAPENPDTFVRKATQSDTVVATHPMQKQRSRWGDFKRSMTLVLASILGSAAPTGYYFHNKIEDQNLRMTEMVVQMQRQSDVIEQQERALQGHRFTLDERTRELREAHAAQLEEVRRMSREQLNDLVAQINRLERRNQNLSSELQQLRAEAELRLTGVIGEIVNLNVRVKGRQGLGSGVWVVGEDGNRYILTNNHVVEDNSLTEEGTPTFDVRLYNGSDLQEAQEVRAELVHHSPEHDMALLRVVTPGFELPPNVPTLRFRDIKREPLRVGERVIVVGTPRGLTDNVTTGTISHVERDLGPNFEPENVFIGVDAPINPGNSGGALFDEQGRLIGINTAGIPGADGLGFSIRIDIVQRVLQGWGVRTS